MRVGGYLERNGSYCALYTYMFSNIFPRMRVYVCPLSVYIYMCIYIYLFMRVRMIHRGEIGAVSAVTTKFSSSPPRYVCTKSMVFDSSCDLAITGRIYIRTAFWPGFFPALLGTPDAHAGVIISTRFLTAHYRRCSRCLF